MINNSPELVSNLVADEHMAFIIHCIIPLHAVINTKAKK